MKSVRTIKLHRLPVKREYSQDAVPPQTVRDSSVPLNIRPPIKLAPDTRSFSLQRSQHKFYRNMHLASSYDLCPHLKPAVPTHLFNPNVEQELFKFQTKIESNFRKSEIARYVFKRPAEPKKCQAKANTPLKSLRKSGSILRLVSVTLVNKKQRTLFSAQSSLERISKSPPQRPVTLFKT